MALTAQTIKGTFSNISRVFGKQVTQEGAEQAVKEGTKQVVKKASSSGIKANALLGATGGTLVGGGVGGIAGLATGADDDDMKSMVFMGAVAGGASGALIGGGAKMVRNLGGKGGSRLAEDMVKNGAETAADIANGKANDAVKGGAKGLFGDIGASVQNFADKIDDFGERISNNISRSSKQEQLNLIKDIKHANPSMTTSQILNDLRNSEGIYNSIYSENVDNIAKAVRKGNTLGGAAQGALIGSAGGALIGGVAGGIDEDESFVGGALKGGLIGGTLGGIGGGASGYFNNNAKILANTTTNVNSLLGR